METVYFYESKFENEIKKILGTDEFMRISFTTKIGGNKEKVGYHIYLIGNQEEIINLERKLDTIGVEKVSEEDEIIIIKKFKEDAENAACGMGMIFG